MLLIYTHKITNRIAYIFDFAFKHHFSIDYRITTERDEFIAYESEKLNYSYENFENIPSIYPKTLLVQDDFVSQSIEVEPYRDSYIFFVTNKGDLPFDVFSASFYLITRYEEYFESYLDRFGRYDPRNSIAWKKGFLNQPIVNHWLNWLLDVLLKYYPDLRFIPTKYQYQPTIDIDNAFAYRRKGMGRQIGGFFKSAFKGDFHDITERLFVISGMEKDPYDTYSRIIELHDRYELTPYYFFLLANYGGQDTSISANDTEFQNLIIRHAERFPVGIHPSFSSYFDISVLKNEVEQLATILGKEVDYSRFHFVKFALPQSYENLLTVGIKHDFSMGYPSRIGFRCGYAGDFKFFNLRSNTPTSLTVHPFQVMDAALNYYMKLDPDEAVNQVRHIIDNVRKVGGTFTTIWHNESLCEKRNWKGWSSVYDQIVRYAAE
ncbi:MAG TPA: polysaccharide deacetylase family protein [Salinivirgaceae bacterium]|nr:polysaccharide deacetylase family protein [Salinivirgaceae bacterium]